MKKLITIISGALLLFSLTGCGDDNTSPVSDPGANPPPAIDPPPGQNNPSPGGNSSISLSWTPPTIKVDGTGLDDIAGYQILYGTSRYALTNEIIITNPSISTYVIEGLSPATYYFVVRAYNTNGVRAPYSNIAEVTAS